MRKGISVPVNNTKSTEVDVRGGRLPVWTQPGEPTTLVFLHLWGGSHRIFAPVIVRLASGCAVVSYDQRGWGAARDLPGPYGISELADDAMAVIAGLGLSRYVLVGHSMGGKVAQLAASRRPEGLAALALIVIPGAGHTPSLTHPDQVNGPLAEFLRQHA
jgi:pimeloyl-ACP methyl ester carboxylesterase